MGARLVDVRGDGILPDWEISELVSEGIVEAPALLPLQIQPASVDLRLGGHAHRLRASFLPGRDGKVSDFVSALSMHTVDLASGGVLEPGSVYLVPLCESLRLPKGMRARANPKSSTGRIDIFARLVTEGGEAFDEVPEGYEGPLWAELSPRTFPVLVRTGSRLLQLRFSRGTPAILTPSEHLDLHGREPLVRGGNGVGGIGDGIVLSVDLEWGPGVAGWRARRHAGAIDVDVVGALDPLDFWEPVRPSAAGIVLDPSEFYILASRETVRIPVGYAAEMMPFDAGVGEFRAHYAGFFDPGFGCGDGVASRGVLEVRPRDVPFLLRQGQSICRLVYERMASPPRTPYGAQSNYQNQGLRLSKAFAPLPQAPR